jgi:hypothetical protein
MPAYVRRLTVTRNSTRTRWLSYGEGRRSRRVSVLKVPALFTCCPAEWRVRRYARFRQPWVWSCSIVSVASNRLTYSSYR